MSKTQVQLTGNESKLLATVGRGASMDAYEITVFVTGGGGNDFGGGTVTIQASPDGGVTKVTLRDVAGTIVSITDDDVYNVRLGYAGTLGGEIQIFATMAGATAPTVDVVGFDNK